MSNENKPTMQHIMDTSKEVHQKMEQIQDEVEKTVFVASSGNEEVTLSLNGKYELIDIKLSPECLKSDSHVISEHIAQAHAKAHLEIAKATRERIINLANHLNARDD